MTVTEDTDKKELLFFGELTLKETQKGVHEMSLVIENVSKQFKNSKKDTLQDVNLEIKEGEFICIVGPSGCGKSTLLNMVAGLEPVNSGAIYLDGEKITGPGADRVVMFQESALFPWLNVIDNVKFGMRIAGIPEEEQNARAEKYLKMVHLWKFKNYQIHELSGGMKQRVALARALTMDSKMLLMDEPFAALDKQTKNMLRDEIQRIWMETKKTVLFVTHSVEEALFFADRIVMLSGNPASVKKIIPVDIPRPRMIDAPDFIEIRAELLSFLRNEVEKVASEEYDN